MKRVGVVGASGRTGRYVVEALCGHSEAHLHSAVVSSGSLSLGHIVAGTDIPYTAELDSLRGADVVIEFTNPEASVQVAAWCARHSVPVLLATTGHSAAQHSELTTVGTSIAVGIVPNTSVGAAALSRLTKEAQNLLGDSFDIEVLDIHHRMKRDAPSGTARSIVSSLVDDVDVIFGRPGKRRSGEVGIAALRGGDVVGDHTVYFLGAGERLELTHRVSSRAVFGQGAVSLALKLCNRPKGVYSATELLVG